MAARPTICSRTPTSGPTTSCCEAIHAPAEPGSSLRKSYGGQASILLFVYRICQVKRTASTAAGCAPSFVHTIETGDKESPPQGATPDTTTKETIADRVGSIHTVRSRSVHRAPLRCAED